MTEYATLLDDMMGAILEGDATAACSLVQGEKDFPPEAQLGVYIDGYRLRLCEALESAYPALAHYLGKQAFTALAASFIAAYPSRHFNLDKYAIGFAGYVAGHSDDAFARDLAALEGAIHDVYQREETPAIDVRWTQSQTPQSLAQALLLPRAASQLLALGSDADAYITAFRAEEKPAPAYRENRLIVLRHKNVVRRLPLERAEYMLLMLLAEGPTLAQALEDTRLAAYLQQENFAGSLPSWLARWVNEGILRQPL